MTKLFSPGLYRRLGQVHLWLGFAVGLQVLIWLGSGLFMVLFPIETVRGEHLRAAPLEQPLDWPADALTLEDLLSQSGLTVYAARAEHLDSRAVWRLETATGSTLLDARTATPLGPISENLAGSIAQSRYTGRGALRSLEAVPSPPAEAGLEGLAWRADFGPEDRASFWINAQTGELRAVRTPLWRAFDFAWGLHIMDWDTRSNFNSWWIKMTAVIAALFALAGTGLAVIRLGRLIAVHKP